MNKLYNYQRWILPDTFIFWQYKNILKQLNFKIPRNLMFDSTVDSFNTQKINRNWLCTYVCAQRPDLTKKRYVREKNLRNQISSLSTEMAAAVGVRDETHMSETNRCDWSCWRLESIREDVNFFYVLLKKTKRERRKVTLLCKKIKNKLLWTCWIGW
jgi:hypothetical protein